jgi:hypothetical protein
MMFPVLWSLACQIRSAPIRIDLWEISMTWTQAQPNTPLNLFLPMLSSEGDRLKNPIGPGVAIAF